MKPITHWKGTVLLAVLCSPFAARALDDTPLSMAFEVKVPNQPTIPNATPQQPASVFPGLDGCRVAVGNLDDLRPSKESLGGMVLMLEASPEAVPLGAASVRSGDGTSWLKGAVDALRAVGLSGRANPSDEGVDLALRIAHTWTGGMNIHSHVVLQASYPQPSGRVLRRYHGFGTKLNGWSANSEFMETLNLGMQDALQAFARDLQRACKGERF
jgi:hypothetical protein